MMISILGLFSLLGLVRAEEKPVETVSLATPLISGSEVTVTVADYQKGLLALLPEQRSTVDNDPTRRMEFMFELYTERMLAHEAQRRGLDQQPDVQAKLAQASRKILVGAILRQEEAKVAEKPHDFTALAEEYYLTHRQEYAQPERIRVAHILWSMKCDCEDQDGKKRAQAESVLKELHAGTDFAELARKYSEDKTSAVEGGDLGQWIVRGALVKPFEEAAFALPNPGAISGVVKTDYGYHIVKLIARESAGIRPFDQVKGQIIESLSSHYKEAAHKAFVAEYYPKAEQYNRSAIMALPLAR